MLLFLDNIRNGNLHRFLPRASQTTLVRLNAATEAVPGPEGKQPNKQMCAQNTQFFLRRCRLFEGLN